MGREPRAKGCWCMSAELLYESARTRVHRLGVGPGERSVIRKTHHGQGAAERLRHERSILDRLTGVPGVPIVVPDTNDGRSILLADDGRIALSASLMDAPMSVPELLDFAVEFTAVLAAVHRRGVVHKDINPANILVQSSPHRR